MAVLLVCLLAGCGGDSERDGTGEKSQRVVNAANVEKLLQTNLESGRKKRRVRNVECPEGEPIRKGARFGCTVTFGNGKTERLTATQIDQNGNVTFRE